MRAQKKGCHDINTAGMHCYNHENKGLHNLDDIVRDYINAVRPRAEAELSFYTSAPSLKEAIRLATNAISPNGKRHDHQRRIPGGALRRFHSVVSAIESQLGTCREFSDLYEQLKSTSINLMYIGELTIYDTALRIGAKLNKYPKEVYLHAGTRRGAKILGLNFKEERLPTNQFPQELQKLKAYEIEDVLCIYKDTFLKLKDSNQT